MHAGSHVNDMHKIQLHHHCYTATYHYHHCISNNANNFDTLKQHRGNVVTIVVKVWMIGSIILNTTLTHEKVSWKSSIIFDAQHVH